MLLPRESKRNDRELRDYLLERLPNEDRERLEEASIVDDEVAVRLRMVEDDLVDGYVRGTLDDATRARFRSHYLSSPRRRERVRFASRFVPAVDRVGARALPSRTALMSRLAAAAAVLLVAAATFLVEGERRSGRPDAPARSAALDPAAMSGSAAAPGRAASAAAATDTAALVLLPQRRGLDSIPALALPHAADSAVLELRLGSTDFPRYQIGLRDPATNQIVWRSAWVESSVFGDRPFVSVVLPARVLKPQHYSLDLVGRTAAGRTAIADSYAFQIVSR